MPSSRSPPGSRCTSPTRRVRGSAARMRTPIAYCANTFRRAPTYPAGTPTTSRRSLTPSTPDHARPSDGAPRPKRSTTTYTHFSKPVLQRPIESSQYTSVRFGETLSLSGLRPSVGSVGDAYDNALAETTIGLYKNECIRADSPFRRGPLRTMSDVELTTADYVAWYNQSRLMHRLGRVPPTEAEAHYYSGHVTDQPAGSQNPEGA